MGGRFLLHSGLIAFTAFSWIASLPPHNLGEFAYLLFIPLFVWIYREPDWKSLFWVGFLSSVFAWLGIFIWLRHVTVVGTLILALCLSLYTVLWLSYVRWLLPRIRDRAFPFRLLGFWGIAGFWVLLEYLRSYLIYGMPMGPLALSQWQKPVLLQMLAWTGSYGLSFFLIFFNCCLAHTIYQMVSFKRSGIQFLRWFKVDFYAAILALIALIFLYLSCLPRSLQTEEAFSFALIQPNFSPLLEWDPLENQRRMVSLNAQVEQTQLLEFDLLLMPESVSPNPILGDVDTLDLFQHWASLLERPILTGNLAHSHTSDIWYNGIFLVDARLGLRSDFYAKRQLVPFGEYTPEPFGAWLEPFGGIQGSFSAGTGAQLIPIRLAGKEWIFGPLICYEDMFPRQVRESVRAGAELLYVATNDAWYGTEGAAFFHAAHSVLRAVENRRPILRCGNAGWSGWIDAYGSIRGILTDASNSIYFKGSGRFSFRPQREWCRQQSFYTRYGDWFVGLSALFSGLAVGLCKYIQRQ